MTYLLTAVYISLYNLCQTVNVMHVCVCIYVVAAVNPVANARPGPSGDGGVPVVLTQVRRCSRLLFFVPTSVYNVTSFTSPGYRGVIQLHVNVCIS